MISPQLTTDLMPHQADAVAKLGRLRVGALFMDMGVGKSRTAIEMAARRAERISRVLWFCPVAIKPTIAAEIRKHVADARIYSFDDRTRSGQVPDADWYIIGIESMSASTRVILAANSITDRQAMLIVDESSYLKGHRASRTEWITRIAERCRYRLILTGTPISQGVVDLFAQMRLLSPDILGYRSFYTFARNHLEYSDRFRGLIVGAHNTGFLAARIAPYTYQVTKAECLTLPKKLHETRWCSMSDEQRHAYELAKTDMMELELDDWSSIVIYQLFSALQQIVCGFWNRGGEMLRFPHSRTDLLLAAVGQMPPDAKIIVWAKYLLCVRDVCSALETEFGESPAQFHGQLSPAQREAELDRWRQGKTRFLVATPSSGGHGLTLNEAHHVIYYTNGFKYSERIQSEDRCHRIGQEQPVTYVDIVCGDSIDERIQQALRKKESVVDAFRQQVEVIRSKHRTSSALKELIQSL